MRKIVSFMHVSLDGFVTGPKGEFDWVKVDDEIFDYAGDRTDHADTALYGRVTYDMMEGYWPTAADQPGAGKHEKHHSAWYKKVSKIVLSHTLKNTNLKNTTIINDNLVDEINKLKQGGDKEIIIFGSPSAVHALAHEDLIDEYWLFVNPVLVGSGVPMFKDSKTRRQLKLLKAHAFSNGVVCLHYQKKN